MPRHNRPDPETGLIPTEPEPGSVVAMDEPMPTRRSFSEQLLHDAYNLRYPTQRAAALPAEPPTVYADAQRDIARGAVALTLRQQNRYTDDTAVIESVTWRAVQPGEAAVPHPFMLDERAARILAEQLGEFHPEMRRLRNAREQLEHSQNEVRSLMNQLEEVRAHNQTLVRVNEEQQRQVRWLERELRDANQERRAATA